MSCNLMHVALRREALAELLALAEVPAEGRFVAAKAAKSMVI